MSTCGRHEIHITQVFKRKFENFIYHKINIFTGGAYAPYAPCMGTPLLPLVILSSWKRLLSHCYPGASILGAEGRDPRFWARGSQGGRGRVVKYYILSCTQKTI